MDFESQQVENNCKIVESKSIRKLLKYLIKVSSQALINFDNELHRKKDLCKQSI